MKIQNTPEHEHGRTRKCGTQQNTNTAERRTQQNAECRTQRNTNAAERRTQERRTQQNTGSENAAERRTQGTQNAAERRTQRNAGSQNAAYGGTHGTQNAGSAERSGTQDPRTQQNAERRAPCSQRTGREVPETNNTKQTQTNKQNIKHNKLTNTRATL